MVLLELGQGWGTGSDVVLLPPPPMFFACQSADEELAVAALPAGRAFAAASEMRSRCWLKINSVGKQIRKKSECSYLAEVIKGVIAHLQRSFACRKTCKLTNLGTEWLV